MIFKYWKKMQKMFGLIVSAVLIGCGLLQVINWVIPLATESRMSAFIRSCKVVREPRFSAPGLPSESDMLFEQCTITIEHLQGTEHKLRRMYKSPPLVSMQSLTVIGSLQWADIFRPEGESRETGTLQGGVVLTAIGGFIGFLLREKKPINVV